MCSREHAGHVKRFRAQASCARIHADGDAERRRRESILPQQRVCAAVADLSHLLLSASPSSSLSLSLSLSLSRARSLSHTLPPTPLLLVAALGRLLSVSLKLAQLLRYFSLVSLV